MKKWRLFLKQGIREMISFKTQFVILLLMSFICMVTITIAISINDRIDNDYNTIIKSKVDQFDEYSDSTANDLNNENTYLLSDFLSDDFLTYQTSNGNKKSIGYNFNYSSFPNSTNSDYNETFLSKTFLDTDDSNFYSWWQKLFINNGNSNNGTFIGNFINSIINVDNSGNVKSFLTWDNNDDSNLFPKNFSGNDNVMSTADSAFSSKVIQDYESDYYTSTSSDGGIFDHINILMRKNLVNDLKNANNNYLKKTMINKLLSNGYLSIDQIWINKDFRMVNDNPDNMNISSNEYQLNLYIDSMIASVWNNILWSIKDVINQDISTYYSTLDLSTSKKLTDSFNGVWEDSTKMFYSNGSSPDDADNASSDGKYFWMPEITNQNDFTKKDYDNMASSMFAYVFGEAPPNTDVNSIIGSNNTVVGQNNNTPYAFNLISGNSYKLLSLDNATTSKSLDNNDYSILLNNNINYYKFGRRGSTENIVFNFNSNLIINDFQINDFQINDENISLCSTANNSWMLDGGIADKSKYILYTYDDNNNVDKLNYNNITISTIYFARKKFIAASVNMNYYSRYELSYIDSVNSKKYRVISFTNNTRDITTIQHGHAPIFSNEILINESFAEANDYGIGDSIFIYNQYYTISGFAADPLNFYSTADIKTMLYTKKTDAIIYMSAYKVQAISALHDPNNALMWNTNILDFYTNNNKIISNEQKEMNINILKGLSYNNVERLSEQKINVENDGLSNFIVRSNIQSFVDSKLAYNFTIIKIVKQYTMIIIAIFSIIIYCVIIYGLYTSIKKTIFISKRKLGLLKSIGYNHWELGILYINSAIIIMTIIIPIAWIVGSLTQELFMMLFGNFFNLTFSIFNFNIPILFGGIFLIGLLMCVFSYLYAILILKKPVINLLTDNNEKTPKFILTLNDKIFKKSNFYVRLSTKLLTKTFSQNIVICGFVFLSSFVISFIISLPFITKNVVSSYYKSINYQNSTPTIPQSFNSPLSKFGISVSQNSEYYSNKIQLNDDSNSELSFVYNSFNNTMGNQDSSPIPEYILSDGSQSSDLYTKVNDQEGLYASDIYKFLSRTLDDNNDSGFQFANSFMSLFGTNMYDFNAKSITVGTLQRLFEYILHSDGAQNLPYEQLNAKIEKLSVLFSNVLPIIVKQMNVSIPDFSANTPWNEMIVDIMLANTPAFVKKYNTEVYRQNLFQIGWNTFNYIPNVDNFATTSEIKDKNQTIDVVGVDNNQNQFLIDKNESKKINIDDETLWKLEQIFYGYGDASQSIVDDNGNLIYDAKNKKINLNGIYSSITSGKYGENNILNTSFSNYGIKLKNNVFIPKFAWAYDDRDYNSFYNNNDDYKKITYHQSLADIENDTNSKDIAWLNPYNILSSKFNYEQTFNKNNTDNSYSINPGASGFGDVYYNNKNNNYSVNIRPYYNYDNLKIFFPKKYESQIGISANSTIPDDGWYGLVPNENDIPQTAIDAWNKELGENMVASDFIYVRPFSPNYLNYKHDKETKNMTGNEISNLINKSHYFMSDGFGNYFNVGTTNDELAKQSNGNIESVEIKNVGKINVYNESFVIANQGLTNLLTGYSTQRYIPYNFSVSDESLISGSYNYDSYKINTYKSKDINDILSENGDDIIYGVDSSQKQVRPMMWSNQIYTSNEEPTFITTQVGFATNPNVGQFNNSFTLFDGSIDELASNPSLISIQKLFIKNVNDIIVKIVLLFIIALIVMLSLVIMILVDHYINEYISFIMIMKMMGYSIPSILVYTLAGFIFFIIVALVVSQILVGITLSVAIHVISTKLISIPLNLLSPWNYVITIVIISVLFIFSIMQVYTKISAKGLNKF